MLTSQSDGKLADNTKPSRPATDFLVIVEFSEIQGPVVACTEPKDLPEDLELDKFVLQVLAVDFRRKRQTGAAPQLNGPDMQTCFTEWRSSLHVFAYHLAVPDFGARGYTRAVCICYCSPTPGKNNKEFKSLTERFSRLSVLLKSSGQATLLSDCNLMLQTLRGTLDNIEKDDEETLQIRKQLSNTFQCDPSVPVLNDIINDMETVVELFSGKVALKRYFSEEIPSENTKPKFRPHNHESKYRNLLQLIGEASAMQLENELKNTLSTFSMNLIDLMFLRRQRSSGMFNIGGWKLHVNGIQRPKSRMKSSNRTAKEKFVNLNSSSNALPPPLVSTAASDARNVTSPTPMDFPNPSRTDGFRQISSESTKSRTHSASSSEQESLRFSPKKREETIPEPPEPASTKTLRRDAARERFLSDLFLVRCFDFAPSLAFTLLSGRPLLVTSAKAKKVVQKAVSSLILLIPSHEQHHSVIRWYDGKINLEICAKHRIVGLSSQWLAESPDNIWNWISVLDLDKNTFYGPEYILDSSKECLLSNIVNPRQRFLNGDSNSFLQHIRICTLHIFQVAWVYFWKHEIGLSKPPEGWPGRRDELYFANEETRVDDNFDKYCDCDRVIVDFWVQLFYNEVCESKVMGPVLENRPKTTRISHLVGKIPTPVAITSLQRIPNPITMSSLSSTLSSRISST